ncbi:MAG: DoxX family protein [Bacteroidota bacterium]|nr:DoxX family protein [Bacteroidota bacterium]
MKIATTILSIVLGIPYLVFGLNYFFNFLPMPPMEGAAGAYIGMLYTSGILMVVKIIEVLVALSLFTGFQRPLALILIAPISVNILLFELLVAKMPGIGIVLVLINAFLIFAYKDKYMSIVK